jgi:hypothetical protein
LNASKTKLKELVNNLYYQKRNSHGNQEKYSKNKMLPKSRRKKILQWKSLDASRRKLDEKKTKAIVLWKKLAIAASLLLFFSLGYQFIKTDSKVITQAERKQRGYSRKTEPKQTEGLSKP